LFLWIYWPSFNAVAGPALFQQTAISNTYISLCTSCIAAIAVARLVKGKLDIEILLNATLAGGVVMGANANILNEPYQAGILGLLTGSVSALGFAYF
jgi:ammonium transporter Rh